MNVVDSCGWLEYLSDGPNADFFAPAIEAVDSLLVPSICIFEVFKKVLSERGEAAALQTIALMRQGEIIDLDLSLAIAAAKLSKDQGLPLADSVVYATSRSRNATVWTQDEHFSQLAAVRFIQKR